MVRRQSLHGQWSSRLAFVLAATGAAVGLGNIWRFPYVTGEHGGGAFVIIYLACVFAIGLPLFMAEAMLGRRGRRNPINAMQLLSQEEAGHSGWQVAGWIGVATGILILSYYSVVAGLTFSYAIDIAAGSLNHARPMDITAHYRELMNSPFELLFWHTLFLAFAVFVVARGVEQGLERVVKFVMPVLFLMLVVVVVYAGAKFAFGQAVQYLFDADFSRVDGDTLLTALGQAFFSLSLGMGAIMAYGAYLPDDASIPGTSFAIVLVDTVVALLAGLAIFSVALGSGLDPATGPGLMFHALPLTFADMPGGVFFGTLFFLLLILAAWSSSIGLIEPAVARMVERHGFSRRNAALAIGALAWLLGVLTLLSFNAFSGVRFLAGSLFENLDYLAANILLPLGGLLVALFAGWAMSKASSVDEFEIGTGLRYTLWRSFTRFVVPLGVAGIFCRALGWLP